MVVGVNKIQAIFIFIFIFGNEGGCLRKKKMVSSIEFLFGDMSNFVHCFDEKQIIRDEKVLRFWLISAKREVFPKFQSFIDLIVAYG